MNVGDLLKRTVYACRLEDTLNDAARPMWEHRVGAAPVFAHGGDVIGFITDRDAMTMAGTCDRAPPPAPPRIGDRP